ncbi:YcaO-like family protein [Streptomyces sp. NPDC002402]
MSGATVQLDGTRRTRSPEDTWAALAPDLPRYGITRVARLTGLDYLGLPVYAAVRPPAQTLAVSQGKGASDLLAKISAVMEAIELWHAEQPLPVITRAAAADLTLPYPLASLPVKAWHAGLQGMPLEWTTGRGVRSRLRVPIPVGLVHRTAARPHGQPDVFRATSTGLACGNTRDEALLHAMYEVVERDALFTDEACAGARRTLIDPRSVADPYCRMLVDRLLGANASLELAIVDNVYAMPVCLAYLWTEDYPVHFAGAGCHTDPHIALSRAITEAAQSRLTCIAGTRDDLLSQEEVFGARPARPPAATGLHLWPDMAAGYEPWRGAFADQAAAVAARIEQVTGHEPLCVDLSTPHAPLSAVKVICPGARSRIRRSVPR